MGAQRLLRCRLKEQATWASAQKKKDLRKNKSTSNFSRLVDQLKLGEVTVLAGRPCMGTSDLALNIALEHCLDRHIPVVYFDLAQTGANLIEKMICNRGEIDWLDLYLRKLTPVQHKRYTKALAELRKAPLVIDDGAHTVETLEDALGQAAYQLNLLDEKPISRFGLVVINAVEYIQASSPEEVGHNHPITHLSLRLKALARNFDIAVVVVTGVEQSVEERASKRPEVTDVEDWVYLKPGVDKVALLYREGIYFPEKTGSNQGIEIILSQSDLTPIENNFFIFHEHLMSFYRR